jgi:hypothetical protein
LHFESNEASTAAEIKAILAATKDTSGSLESDAPILEPFVCRQVGLRDLCEVQQHTSSKNKNVSRAAEHGSSTKN